MKNLLPKDFFPHIHELVSVKDFNIIVNGEFCPFQAEEINHFPTINGYEELISVTGILFPEKELDYVNVGKTVARIGSHDVPCEIATCSFDYNYNTYRNPWGSQEQVSTIQKITISVAFRYSSYNYRCGDITNTSEGITPELKHVLAIADKDKKKTIFDWLDLD